MSTYTIRLHAPLDHEVVRIFRGQINSARRALRTSSDESVHSARKAVKRSRAVLRLVRGALDEERLRQLDRGLRATARRMGPVRDAAVALILVRAMEVEEALDASTAAVLLEALEAEHNRAWEVLEAAGGTESIRTDLNAFRLTLDDVAELDVLTLHDGLAWTYRRGHSRLAEASQRPGSETLHAWRRQVKHLGYQLRLLAPAWPMVLRPTVRAFDALSDALGDDHDLAELVRHAGKAGLGKRELRAVRRTVRTRSKAFQKAAWPIGARLYAETGVGFAGRITVYLATALAEQHRVPIRPLDGLAVPFPPNRSLASDLVAA